MKTIALRFSNNYAPKEGMMYHQQKLYYLIVQNIV